MKVAYPSKWLILLFLLTGYFTPVVHAEQCSPMRFHRVFVTENQLQVNALKVGRYFVSHSMDNYAVNQRLLVPLSLVSELMSLETRVASDEIYIEETKNHCGLTIQLKQTPFDDGSGVIAQGEALWAQDEFDIYLDVAFLEALFEGKATQSLSSLLIHVETEKDVELANKKEPASKQNYLQSEKPRFLIGDQYHLSTFPTADVDLRYRYNDEASESDYDARVNAYFDTLFHATELRINQSDDTDSQRLKFSRDFRLGGKNATVSSVGYEVGDIFTTSDNLIAGSNLGAGLFLFTGDKNQFNAFNAISIQETVAPNWRGELYRNGQFIEAQTANDENQLVFDSVPAYFGPNRYELRLFGPDGQEETRIRTYQMGRDQLVENKFDIEVYSVNPGDNFIDNDDANEPIYSQANKIGLRYGFSQDFTAGLSFQSLDHITEGKQDYVTASMYKQYGPGAFNLEVGSELGEGYAIFGGYSGYWQNQYNVSFDVSHYDDFTSQLRADSSDLETQLRARISGSTELWGGLGWNASLAQQFNETDDDNFQALFSATKTIPYGALSSSFSYNEKDGLDRLNNNLYWVQNYGFGSLSVGLNWYPLDGFDVNNGSVEARWASDDRLFQITRLQYLPSSEDKYRLNHQLNWRTKQFTLTSGVTVNESGDWEFSAGFVTSIGYDYVNKKPRFSHKKSSSSGNLHMLAFLDRDRNGQLTAGDRALQNVKFAGNSDWRDVATDKFGQAVLMGASTSGQQLVGVDLASLQDPFLYPTYKKLAVKTHPGGLNRIMLPVLSFSDIEGSVYVEDSFGTRGMRGVPIRLMRHKQLAYGTESEMDGYFAFSQVEPGNYTLHVDPDFLEDKQLSVKALPQKVAVEESGDIIWLSDLILTKLNANSQGEQSTAKHPKQEKRQLPPQAQSLPNPQLLVQPHIQGALGAVNKGEGYFVQVGVYKKARSAPAILNALPLQTDGTKFKTQTFRNTKSGMSYIVAGAFATKPEAMKALQRIRTAKTLSKSFVAPASKFENADFQQQHLTPIIGVKGDKEAEKERKLSKALRKQQLLLDRKGKGVCQLGSYKARKFIRWKAVNDADDITVVEKQINGETYHVIVQFPTRQLNRDEVLASQINCEASTHPITNKKGWWRTW